MTASASATFIKQDTTTQGTWIGAYGTQGYDIINGAASLPSYATVTPAGESSCTWAASTTDARALENASGSGRIAACWYSSTSLTVDVDFTDGQTHDLELYFVDWDSTTRAEQVQISNASTGAVLNTETVKSFNSGVYLDWAISGNVLITITHTAGANAVLSGLFFDDASPKVIAETPAAGATSVDVSSPVTATFNEPVQASSINFLLTNSSGTAVPAALAYDSANDTATLTPDAPLASGTTYTATVSGAEDTSGSAMAAPFSWSFTPDMTTSAAFVRQDTTTQGTWIGTYGTQGYDIINGAAGLPSYATVTPAGESSCTWAASTSDARALENASGSGRIAACWYSSTSLTVDVDFTDGQTHDLELYFVDWDSTTRAEQVQISNASTGAVLNTETVKSFNSGVYLDWAVSGNVLITITHTAGANAVLSGLFFDEPPTVTAEAPVSGATGAAVAAPVTATFNEAVQAGSIDFLLTTSSGTVVPATVEYNSTSKTATLTPTTALAYGTTYTATVGAAENTAGDPMTGPVSWTFTTNALSTTTVVTPAAPVPTTMFGFQMSSLQTTPGYFPSVPTSVDVLWDSEVAWAQVEPSPGQFDFTLLDSEINTAIANGAQPVYTLGVTPAWAASDPTSDGAEGPGSNSPPANMNDFELFVQTLLQRYAGKLRYLQLWNEADTPEFFDGTVSQMVQMCQIAYDVAQEFDPSIQIISPSVVYVTSDSSNVAQVQWFQQFLAQGGGNYCDIIGMHDYAPGNTPETRAELTFPTIEALLQQYDLQQKPLWDTESTYSSTDFATALASAQEINPSISSDTLQAAYLARTYLLNWAYGVTNLDWYGWDNKTWAGIFPTEADNVTLSPAGTAYQTIEQWMVGSVMNSLTYDSAGDYEVSLTMSNGSNAMIVWNANDASTSITLPSDFQPTGVTTLAGVASAYTGGSTIAIGAEPVLLTTAPLAVTAANELSATAAISGDAKSTSTTAAVAAITSPASATISGDVISAATLAPTVSLALEPISPASNPKVTTAGKTWSPLDRRPRDQHAFQARELVRMTRSHRVGGRNRLLELDLDQA